MNKKDKERIIDDDEIKHTALEDDIL